jgi:hypothetical protein
MDKTTDPPIQTICNAFKVGNVECKAGNAFYFPIDNKPVPFFSVRNDSGVIITDLHLEILNPGKYKVDLDPKTGGILKVTADPNGAFTQPDASWDKGRSDIFDKITRSNNNRTIDFTDPKAGTKGLDKGVNLLDGKEIPENATLPILVKSSFSVPKADAKSDGKSVIYDPISATLSFANDFINSTFDPLDPVLGAEVSPPAFRKVGSSGSQVNFAAIDPLFALHDSSTMFLTGAMDILTYSIPANQFFGTVFPISIAGVDSGSPFFSSTLPDLTSEFLEGIDEYLNPNSTIFDPNSRFFYTAKPEANFFALTNGFSTRFESPLTNSVFVAAVPEPGTLALLVIGTWGLLAACWWTKSRS